MRRAHQSPISPLNLAKLFEAPVQSALECNHHPEPIALNDMHKWLDFASIRKNS